MKVGHFPSVIGPPLSLRLMDFPYDFGPPQHIASTNNKVRNSRIDANIICVGIYNR